MRRATPDMPVWEQRLRSIVGNPKLPREMETDIIQAMQEMDHLRADLARLRELADGPAPSGGGGA